MKKKFAVLLVLLCLLVPALYVSGTAHAVNVFGGCSSVPGESATDVCKSASSAGSTSVLVTSLKTIFNILSFVIGIAAVIMLVIGGLKLIASQGDPSNVKSGRDTITYSLVGLAAAALAQVIVVFVLNKLS